VGYAIRATGKRAKHHDVTVAVSKLAAGRAALDACRTCPSRSASPSGTRWVQTPPSRGEGDLELAGASDVYSFSRTRDKPADLPGPAGRMAECATSPDLEWTLQKPDHTDAFADVALESSAAVDAYSFEAAAGQKAFFDIQRRRDV
jgi:hypothetical protein